MRVSVCRPGELDASELRRWRELQSGVASLRHPFLSGEFACAVGAVSPRARVAVAEEGSRIVGFLPYDLDALGVARALGGALSYRQAFVHEPGLRWSWSELMRLAGLHAIELSNLVATQGVDERSLQILGSPIIDTTGSWETYLKTARTHKHTKTILYKARKLEREVGGVEFTWSTSRTPDLDRLIAWKSEQYRRSGWRDPFARPWVRALLESLADGAHGDLRAVTSTLRAGGDLLAVDLSLGFDNVLAGWFSAYDAEHAASSPGAIRMLRAIEHACGADIAYIDMARGDETYKQALKTSDLPVAAGCLHQRSARAALYRAGRAPVFALESYVLTRPRLRAFVRSSLRSFGAARSGLAAPRAATR